MDSNNIKSRDIQDLNLAYLFCLREMARKDVAEAALRFGIDMGLAKAVAESSAERLMAIADPSMLQFKMRSPLQLRAIIRGEDGAAALRNVVSLISEVATNE